MPQTFTVGSRSILVTVTAWLVMALAVLAVLSIGAALGWPWPAALGPLAGRLRGVARLADLAPWLLTAGVLLAVAFVACAIGLLRRLEWARRVAIAVLVLALCGQLAGLWLQHEVVAALLDITQASTPLPATAAGVLGSLAWAAQAMGWLLTVAACVLLAWLIVRLMSQPVRQEFA